MASKTEVLSMSKKENLSEEDKIFISRYGFERWKQFHDLAMRREQQQKERKQLEVQESLKAIESTNLAELERINAELTRKLKEAKKLIETKEEEIALRTEIAENDLNKIIEEARPFRLKIDETLKEFGLKLMEIHETFNAKLKEARADLWRTLQTSNHIFSESLAQEQSELQELKEFVSELSDIQESVIDSAIAKLEKRKKS